METLHRRRLWAMLILLSLAAFLVAVAPATVAAPAETLARRLLAGGGGRHVVGDRTLRGAVGQPVTGLRTTGGAELCAGMLCGLGRYEVLLPLVLRS